jgi:hypothetical protein
MIFPTVHLNGTGRDTLSDGYSEAGVAVERAIKALAAVEFNSRDYYVQPAGAWEQARAEMEARFTALRQVRADLLAIYERVNGLDD